MFYSATEPLKLLCLIFIFSLVTGCSSEEQVESPPAAENPDENAEPPTTGENPDNNGDNNSNYFFLDPDKFQNLDYENIAVFSSDESFSINDDGTFEKIEAANDNTETLPLIFTVEGEVLFGIFIESISDDEISLVDILNFFITMHPEISLRGFESIDIKSKIQELPNKAGLLNQISVSINNQQNPLDNFEFQENLTLAVDNIIENSIPTNAESFSKEYIQDFQITYKRDGGITIPNESPFFAAIGIQIRNLKTNNYLTEKNILPSKSLALSPGSYSDWLGQQLFPEAFSATAKNFQLLEEGKYRVDLTNGNGSSGELYEYVKNRNQLNFAKLVIGNAFSKGLKKLFKKAPECVRELDFILEALYAVAVEYQITPPAPEDLLELTRSTSTDVAKLAYNCLEGGNLETYLGFLNIFFTKYMSSVESITELLYFSRDFFNAELNAYEFRNFDNEISYGALTLENISETTFEGKPEEEFLYEASVEEEEIRYEVHRLLTSELIKKREFKPANQLPFKIEIDSGDVQIGSELELTNFGDLFADFKLGEENSKVKISPDFLTSDITPVTVELLVDSPCELVKDIDGNEYQVVTIGEQCWTQSNLNVSHYRNGDPIPQVSTREQLEQATVGAWCYLRNDSNNGALYGKLYNWHAVNDPRGLAPEGFHVPDNEEWFELINFLGGSAVAGGKMKAVGGGWLTPNVGATNESGFSALPGMDGATISYSDDQFQTHLEIVGNYARWWSSSEKFPIGIYDYAYIFYINDDEALIRNTQMPVFYANSVRLIKD